MLNRSCSATIPTDMESVSLKYLPKRGRRLDDPSALECFHREQRSSVAAGDWSGHDSPPVVWLLVELTRKCRIKAVLFFSILAIFFLRIYESQISRQINNNFLYVINDDSKIHLRKRNETAFAKHPNSAYSLYNPASSMINELKPQQGPGNAAGDEFFKKALLEAIQGNQGLVTNVGQHGRMVNLEHQLLSQFAPSQQSVMANQQYQGNLLDKQIRKFKGYYRNHFVDSRPDRPADPTSVRSMNFKTFSATAHQSTHALHTEQHPDLSFSDAQPSIHLPDTSISQHGYNPSQSSLSTESHLQPMAWFGHWFNSHHDAVQDILAPVVASLPITAQSSHVSKTRSGPGASAIDSRAELYSPPRECSLHNKAIASSIDGNALVSNTPDWAAAPISPAPSRFFGPAVDLNKESFKETSTSQSNGNTATPSAATRQTLAPVTSVSNKPHVVVNTASILNEASTPPAPTILDSSASIVLDENYTKITTNQNAPLSGLHFFKDNWDPHEKSDNPVFWHIPKSGGSSVKDIIGSCHNLVMASEFGITEGHANDTVIAVVYPKGSNPGVGRSPFVNVDTTTVEGINRAKAMGFADAHLAEVTVTPFVYESNNLFTNDTEGRLFAVFRHPIDRAISMFYYLQVATWESTYKPELKTWTVEQYAQSHLVENNWMTRMLSNHPMEGAILDDGSVKIAMEVVRQKFLVGLLSDLEGTMDRFERFFGWTYHVNPTFQEACRQNLLSEGSNSNSVQKKEKPQPGSPAWEALASQNQYDIQLYDYIQTLYKEQQAFVAGIPEMCRLVSSTCCKCDPPTFPPEGYNCPAPP